MHGQHEMLYSFIIDQLIFIIHSFPSIKLLPYPFLINSFSLFRTFSRCEQHKELLRSGKLSHQSPTSKHRNGSRTGFADTSPTGEIHGSPTAVAAIESRYMEHC